MSTAVVTDPQLQSEALTISQRAQALTISCNEELTIAGELGTNIAGLMKKAIDWFAPMKRLADQTHREICAKENEIVNPLKTAKQYLSKEIGRYNQEQEKARLVEERRLQELAAEESRKAAAALAAETALADAIELEAAGDLKGAEAVLNNPVPQPVFIPPVVVPRSTPKLAGVSGRETWKFKITDPTLIPDEYWIVDEKAIGEVVKALKSKTNIPGIQPYPEGAASFRG